MKTSKTPSQESNTLENFTSTQRSTVKRLPKRSNYERETVYQILDEGLICHVGFVVDNQPYVIPTAYARVGDKLYIHGSPASRMLRTLQTGIEVCLTVTLLDGLVLARSAFHHSMNYRSVVVFGKASVIEDANEKLEALHAFTEHVVLGRWQEIRQPSRSELAGTLVLSLPLVEVSAKVRTGPPADDEADYELPVWAGEIPLRLVALEPINDPRLQPGIVPSSTFGSRFSQQLQSAKTPFHTPKPSLFSLASVVKAIWQRLLRILTISNELQVVKKKDRNGNTYWQAYDPATGKSTSLGSEAEMRVWIEQRYYQPK